MHDILLPKGMCSESRDLFKIWEVSDYISKTMQDRDKVAMKDQAYRMVPLSMPLNDLEGHFFCLKLL